MKKSMLFLILPALFFSCAGPKEHFPKEPLIFGLASPVTLKPDTTLVLLTDYFRDCSVIDSVAMDKNLNFTLAADKKQLRVVAGKALPVLSEMKVWVKGFPYSILVKKSQKVLQTITFDPAGKTYKLVQVAGEINGWNPKVTPLSLTKDGKWEARLLLNPGNYQYKLVLDGKWVSDPANPDSADNGLGAYNSLMKVGQTDPEARPFLSTFIAMGREVTITCSKPAGEVFVFWQNYRLPAEFISPDGKDRMKIRIPRAAGKMERSCFRVWAFNEAGLSNDLLIPLEKDRVLKQVSQLRRDDFQAMILYFMMVDRFMDGDKSNDHPLKSPEVLPKADYQGGDLAGITEKLKEGYFDDLGVNTLWLSPVSQNPADAWGQWKTPPSKFSAYHGYWPVSLSKVDFHFGTDKDLQSLVDQAHNKNYNVLLDYVAHHVHQNHPMVKQHPDWFTPLYLPDGTMNTEKWDEYRLTTWFDTFLPTIDLSRQDIVNVMSDSAVFWIKKFGIDGFRHDATKHIPEIFWRTLTTKLKDQVEIPGNRPVYQIGETYGNRELIGSYINSGELDAQFDFGVWDAALPVFAKDNVSFKGLANSLSESFTYYGFHHLMGNISGNQDKPRFISLAGGDLKFEENSKLAGWTRNIGVGDPVGYRKLASLMAFNMTIPGIPVIYYGDEYGMPGANDPDNRRVMKFSGYTPDEQQMLETTKKLTHLRKSHLSLIFGDTRILDVTDNTFAYLRTYFDELTMVAFNKDKVERTVELTVPDQYKPKYLKANFGSKFTRDKRKITLTLAPHSFDVLTNK